MSALEFAAAIKWPVTVLILAAMATVLLRRSPGTRQSVGEWFRRRNLRLNVAGQEFEATVAETQGSIGAAISPDAELAEAVAPTPETGEAQDGSGRSTIEREVENARRRAVGTLAQNAVRLGWLWGRGERGASEPRAMVTWNGDGQPDLRVFASEDIGTEVRDWLEHLNIRSHPSDVAELRTVLRRQGWTPSGEQPSPTHPRQEHPDGGGDALL